MVLGGRLFLMSEVPLHAEENRTTLQAVCVLNRE